MRFSLSRAALGSAGALALFGGAVLGSLPASAATITAADCATQSGNYAVKAVRIDGGETITLSQTGADGHFEGAGTAEVYCRKGNDNLGDITDAQVRITVTSDSGAPFIVEGLNGVPTSGTNPAVLGPFTGTVDFAITAPSSLLPPGTVAAEVGTHVEVVTQAWGAPLINPQTGNTLQPRAAGDIVAQTPELDSLPLFASGALGLLSYAGLRRRARGK